MTDGTIHHKVPEPVIAKTMYPVLFTDKRPLYEGLCASCEQARADVHVLNRHLP